MIKYLDLKAINQPDVHAADEVLRSGWYLRGEATRRFEQHYADYIGTRHCIGCGNGLDALTIILRAYKELGVMREGDEVLVPANTYIATILSITENGLVPVLVEPSCDTLQIDDSLIEQAITPRTRALMIVHLYGRCAYTSRIADICQKYDMRLIEDNAQAHGCYCQLSIVNSQLKKTGSLGHAAAHSFYPGKNLGALGDAGAVTTDDDALADIVRALGNYGSHRKYVHEVKGRNSRIDELQAAILDAKLSHLDADNERRRVLARVYINKVYNPLLRLPLFTDDNVWHVFPLLTPHRDQLQHYLLEHGVETQIHYPIPPHRQQCYSEWSHLSLPVTEQLSREELSLPCNQAMTLDEAETIVALLNRFTV